MGFPLHYCAVLHHIIRSAYYYQKLFVIHSQEKHEEKETLSEQNTGVSDYNQSNE